jgi:ParB family transcriptional regulator, chromosome partitioning protein
MSAHPPYFANAEVLALDPTTIDTDMGGRIGLYYPDKCHALAALISVHGQNDPIKVVKAKGKYAWRLVAGLHRLQACMSIGIDVRAIEIIGRDDVELEQIQASENVDRRELEPLERAMFVRAVATAARLRVLKEHGVDNDKALAAKAKARAGKVQYSELNKADEVAELAGDNLSLAYGWAENAAEALGMGKRDLQRSMRIHRMIIEPFPEMIDHFKDHPVAKVADNLLKIAAIKKEVQRRRVIEILLAGPKDLGFALKSAGVTEVKAAPEDYKKFSSQVIGGWNRLSTAEKRQFIPALAVVIPKGMRALVRDELDRLDQLDRVKPNAVEHYTKLADEAAEVTS